MCILFKLVLATPLFCLILLLNNTISTKISGAGPIQFSVYIFICFSDVNVRVNGRTPLLMFCDALMSSVSMEHTKPDQKLSLECVQCTLKENRLDLLAHWIAQNRFVAFQVGFSFA